MFTDFKTKLGVKHDYPLCGLDGFCWTGQHSEQVCLQKSCSLTCLLTTFVHMSTGLGPTGFMRAQGQLHHRNKLPQLVLALSCKWCAGKVLALLEAIHLSGQQGHLLLVSQLLLTDFSPVSLLALNQLEWPLPVAMVRLMAKI